MRKDYSMKLKYYLSLVFILSFLSACTAVGVPIIFNPQDKLAWSEKLIDTDNRPFPAEILISEAVQRYKNDNDEVGLAYAYRMYAYLLESEAINNRTKYKSFFDKMVTYDNRYQKSLEYWQKSLEIFEKKFGCC